MKPASKIALMALGIAALITYSITQILTILHNMKALTLILGLLTLNLAAQYPDKVNQIMIDSATTAKPIDTVYFENYRYVFSVKGDSNLTRWDLISKKKLYTDYWKAAGVTYFFSTWAGAFFVVPGLGLEKDKYYHAAAGSIVGVGANIITYKITKNKWLGLTAGAALPWIIGAGKEGIDKVRGGQFSVPDMLSTGIPGMYCSLGTTIVIGNKTKKKH